MEKTLATLVVLGPLLAFTPEAAAQEKIVLGIAIPANCKDGYCVADSQRFSTGSLFKKTWGGNANSFQQCEVREVNRSQFPDHYDNESFRNREILAVLPSWSTGYDELQKLVIEIGASATLDISYHKKEDVGQKVMERLLASLSDECRRQAEADSRNWYVVKSRYFASVRLSLEFPRDTNPERLLELLKPLVLKLRSNFGVKEAPRNRNILVLDSLKYFVFAVDVERISESGYYIPRVTP